MSAPLLVADSGPLIALARLDLLHLPSAIFSDTWITATVWDEVQAPQHPAEHKALQAAREHGLVRVMDDPVLLPDSVTDLRLDLGERTVLALAIELHATVLMDERHGRACAARIGLPVVGTLGLLVAARLAGLIPEVRPLTEALRAGGYFLASHLVEQTLASISE